MRHIRPMLRNPCGIYSRGYAIYAAYTAGSPQSMRHIRSGLRNLCDIYGWVSAVYAAYTTGPTQSILFNNISYRNIQSSVGIYFGSVLNCQYRSIQAQVSIFQHSTIAALYKKRPRGVQRGAALCPFAVFSHSNVIYPLRASAVYVPYSRNSAIHAAIRPGSPQPMRLLFPHTKFRKYLINKVFPK